MVCKNWRLHPSGSPNTPCCLLYVALAACTPRHLVTPSIPVYLYRDWFLVLRLANLDPAGASFTPTAAGNADAAKSGVNLSLFLEPTSTARGYGKSWVTLPLSWVAEVCGAMHSCHVDDLQLAMSCRHSLCVRTAHAAFGFDKRIDVGVMHFDLEPDEQHVDHSDRRFFDGCC